MKILWMILVLCGLPLLMVAQISPTKIDGRDQVNSVTPENRPASDADKLNNKRQLVEVQAGAGRDFNRPNTGVVQDTLYVQPKPGERVRLDLSGYNVRPVVIVLPPDGSEQPAKRDDE